MFHRPSYRTADEDLDGAAKRSKPAAAARTRALDVESARLLTEAEPEVAIQTLRQVCGDVRTMRLTCAAMRSAGD